METTVTVRDLISQFEAWANPAWQEKWDNSGWQVEPGILDDPAGVLVCLTPTLAVFAEAQRLQQQGAPVNLIFAHHPLIFSPLKAIVGGDPVAEMVRLSLSHRIGLYSAHTNFDQVDNGTADVLAQCLALQQTVPIVPTQPGIGYGRIGHLPQPMPLETVLQQIQAKLQPPTLLHSPADLQQTIERVAVLGGSGASFIEAVAATDAQLYLTADCKFHQFQDSRDRNLVLVDTGHYASERPACARLVTYFLQQGIWAQLSRADEDFRQTYAVP